VLVLSVRLPALMARAAPAMSSSKNTPQGEAEGTNACAEHRMTDGLR
jgi:hypothetical protein